MTLRIEPPRGTSSCAGQDLEPPPNGAILAAGWNPLPAGRFDAAAAADWGLVSGDALAAAVAEHVAALTSERE